MNPNSVFLGRGYYTGGGPFTAVSEYCGSRLTGILTDVVLFGGTTTIDAATLSAPTAWADVIQVRWQATDSEVLAIMSSTLTTSPISPSTSAKAGSSTSAAATNKSHLSTSADAGIGVGAAVVIIVALLAGFLVLRHRRNKKEPPIGPLMENQRPGYKHELSTESQGIPWRELDNERHGVEAGGFGGPVELGGFGRREELGNFGEPVELGTR